MPTLTQAYTARLQEIQRDLVRRGEAALAEAGTGGALALDRALEDAVTDTGYYRMLIRGGRPGRHDTGNMVSKIRTDAQHPVREQYRSFVSFGWFAGDFEAYFREQDQGGPPVGGAKRGIPAAEALKADEGTKPGFAALQSQEILRAAMGRHLP